MKKILNALFLTIITLVTFSCSDVPAPYGINIGGGDAPILNGDGTKENPYDIASAKIKQDGSEAWVMGYIVGCVNDLSISESSAFAAPFTNAANILIAASATETDYKNCIAVQLVNGSPVRTALNLVDNGGNLGKAVFIKGQLTKYFGVAGLKTTTAAVLDGTDIGEGGNNPEPGDQDNPFGLDASSPVNDFEATFEDIVANTDYALAGWTNAYAQGTRKWQGKSFSNTTTGGVDNYIQATAQGATAGQTYESWFITPAFTVNNIKDSKISFDCAGAYFIETSSLKVFFLELVNGKMVQTAVNVTGIPTSGTNYAWATGLTIDLTPFAGKVGFIGFQYIGIGGSGTSATYCLDNIKAGAGNGGVDPDPDPNPNPDPNPSTDNLLTNPGFEDWTGDLPVGWDNAYNTLVTKETEIKHSGNNSVKHTATATAKIQQEVAVEAGKTYKISYWYLDNDVNAKSRIYSYWVGEGTSTLQDNAAELRPNTYSDDSADWKQVSIQLTAPAGATKLRFEVRTYKGTDVGGSVYYDDMEVSEVK